MLAVNLKSSKFFYGLTVLFFLTSIIRQTFASLNYDAAWLLYVGQQVRGGAQIYVDILEVNPPLIVWIAWPALWLSEVSGLSPGGAYRAWVFCLAAVSLCVSTWLLKRMQVSGAAWMIAVLAFAFTWFAGDQFAQREHFLVILILPYVILVAGRAAGVKVPILAAATIAIFAGIGICIKPYFILIPAALEIYLLCTAGYKTVFKRLEPYVMVTVGMAYLLAIFAFTPQYIDAAFGYISDVYGAGFKTDIREVLADITVLILWLLIGGRAAMIIKPDFKKVPALYVVFCLTAAALLAAFFIQFKGWPNHTYPIYVFAFIPAIAGVMKLSQSGRALKPYATLLGFAVAAMALLPPVGATWVRKDNIQISAYLKSEHNAKSIYIMSANLTDGFPLVTEHGLTWGSRFASLWMTPGLQAPRGHLNVSQQARLKTAEDFNRTVAAQDLARNRPDVILVDIRDDKDMFRAPFDYIADFSKNAEFAREFSNYEKTDWPGVHALYVRKP